MRDLNRISQELKSIDKKLKSQLNIKTLGNVDFDCEQQELIRRVFKSILPQLKGVKDRLIAKDILKKTEWIDDG